MPVGHSFYANSGSVGPLNANDFGSAKGKRFKGGMKSSGKGSKGKAKGKFSHGKGKGSKGGKSGGKGNCAAKGCFRTPNRDFDFCYDCNEKGNAQGRLEKKNGQIVPFTKEQTKQTSNPNTPPFSP